MKFDIGFICAMNNVCTFSNNLGKSSAWLLNDRILLKDYTNISLAYNEGISKFSNEILIFVHQDVYLPEEWAVSLEKSLNKLQNTDWGVLGVAGASLVDNKIQYVGYIKDRGLEWEKTNSKDLPKVVETVDELLLIIKNDNSFIFDEEIPSCDFYGVDICLQSHKQGKKNYIIDAYLHHNSSRQRGIPLPKEFFVSRNYIINKWKSSLPVATTCTILK